MLELFKDKKNYSRTSVYTIPKGGDEIKISSSSGKQLHGKIEIGGGYTDSLSSYKMTGPELVLFEKNGVPHSLNEEGQDYVDDFLIEHGGVTDRWGYVTEKKRNYDRVSKGEFGAVSGAIQERLSEGLANVSCLQYITKNVDGTFTQNTGLFIMNGEDMRPIKLCDITPQMNIVAPDFGEFVVQADQNHPNSYDEIYKAIAREAARDTELCKHIPKEMIEAYPDLPNEIVTQFAIERREQRSHLSGVEREEFDKKVTTDYEAIDAMQLAYNTEKVRDEASKRTAETVFL